MINSTQQLSAKIRNLAKGDSTKCQVFLREYMMERFLERLSLSPYKTIFIVKGGMLISSMVGINYRTTMDIDVSAKLDSFYQEKIEKIINEIINIKIMMAFHFALLRLRIL